MSIGFFLADMWPFLHASGIVSYFKTHLLLRQFILRLRRNGRA